MLLVAWLAPDFSTSTGKSRIRQFFRNLAKFGSGQISCRMPVHVQYVQLITDKSSTRDMSSGVFNDMSSGVFKMLISVTRMTKIQNSLPFHKVSKTGKQWHNKRSTELYCLFTAADSIVNAICFIRSGLLSPSRSGCVKSGTSLAGSQLSWCISIINGQHLSMHINITAHRWD